MEAFPARGIATTSVTMPVEKKVQVVGYPPAVQGPPQEVETDSENEAERADAHVEGEGDQDEVAVADEGIDELMAAFDDDETEIYLTHLRLTSTRPLNLARFANTLERLGLRQNEIKTMHSKDLGQLVHLKELDFYDNAIEHIAGLDNCTELE